MFVLFYDVPGGEVWQTPPPPPPMKVTLPGFKGGESADNYPNTCFIILLTVCLYRYFLPRLCRNLGDFCALILIIHTHIILCANFNQG